MVEVENPVPETDLARRVSALVHTPAGPDLATRLADLDPSALTDYQCVDVLQARYRQANHDRGELFAMITEVIGRHKRDEVGPQHDPEEWGTCEVQAALVLTRRAADDLCVLATDLVRRLPVVQAALTAGVLDQPRARVFSSLTGELADAHAAAVVAAVLPKAPRLTTSELVAAIRRQAIALDPTWARRRYEKALRSRRVQGIAGHDGTGTLAGYDLPADQVAAACARLDALAKAAKQAGHPAPIDYLRADLFLGMTDGSYAGLDDTQILARLIATIPRHPESDTGAESGPDTKPGPDTGSAADAEPGPDTESEPGTESGSGAGPAADADDPRGAPGDSDGPGDPDAPQPGAADDATTADDTEADATAAESTVETPDPTESTVETPDPGGPDPAADESMAECAATGSTPDASPVDAPRPPADHSTADDPDAAAASPTPAGPTALASARSGVRSGQLRLLVGLGCLAGLDARGGELLGWGPVHAELARTMATARGASWWYVLADDDGSPRDVGLIRRRPTDPATTDATRPGYSGVQVWVQISEAMLAALAADPPPGWAGVLAEIVRRTTASPGGPPNGDPADRVPNAALRRWLIIRDRYCTFPGCRVPAHRCDADHTVEHVRHGPTIDENLGATCRRHHRLRHVGGWTVVQTRPGHVAWTSYLGRTYLRTPPPGPDDLPDPMPHPTPHTDDDHPDGHDPVWRNPNWHNDTCLYRQPPPPPAPEPPPPPASTTPADEDIPPF